MIYKPYCEVLPKRMEENTGERGTGMTSPKMEELLFKLF